MRWLTLDEARAVNKLQAARRAAEKNGNWENNRQKRRNLRSATKAQDNLNRYVRALQNKYGISYTNVFHNFLNYNKTIPGLTNNKLWAPHLYKILRPTLVGNNVPQSLRNRVNRRIAGYMLNGTSRENATRRVLQSVFGLGARTSAAVRTLQRAFRQKRAARMFQPAYAELAALQPVPTNSYTSPNRTMKPSNIKEAHNYLASQGYRLVKRVRRT